MHGQPDLGGAVDGLPEHEFGAPGDLLEQAAVRALEADKVIAAIRGLTENDPVARHCERMGGFDEHRSRQRRTVGVDEAGRAVAGSEQVRRGVAELAPRPIRRGGSSRIASGTTPANDAAEPGGE